jgi:hypothetical protein
MFWILVWKFNKSMRNGLGLCQKFDTILFATYPLLHDCYLRKTRSSLVPRITYFWTVPLSLDHSYLVGKLTSSNLLIQKCPDFRGSNAFVQFFNLSCSQTDTSGPILGDLSNNRWSGGTFLQMKWFSGWSFKVIFWISGLLYLWNLSLVKQMNFVFDLMLVLLLTFVAWEFCRIVHCQD